MALLQTRPIDPKCLIQSRSLCWHSSRLVQGQRKDPTLMTKTLDTISEAIRNPKHPFRQVADRPDKPHKNRYERRKVKQYIHLGDWVTDSR